MTLVEKIFAKNSQRDTVKAGDLLLAKLDLCLGNDITGPVAFKEFKKLGIDKVFDRDRVVMVPDHFTPNKDIASAQQSKALKEYAREYNLTYYFEVGRMGIEHVLLPEEGLVLPGEIIIGADSHTCTYGAFGAMATGVGSTDLAAGMATGIGWFRVPETIMVKYMGKLNPYVNSKDLILHLIGTIGVEGARYKALEFRGEIFNEMSMDQRMTISNMSIEAGGKCGLFEPDGITEEYLKGRAKRDYKPLKGDVDAEFYEVIEFDLASIEPQVAFPHSPANTKGISNVGEILIDQVVIGSCTNGRLCDLKEAADILKNNKVDKNVRLIIIPGSQDVYLKAMEEGYMETFIKAGAVVSTPTCGPCLGGYMGILAKGERAVSTTNRNFVGRMGHVESEVYLAGPAVAAASAITGKISSPKEVI
jgi:3-isopropylmalate/(R)-2-methylmalate dehydratase large subunit